MPLAAFTRLTSSLTGAPWKITTKVALNGKPIYELTSPDDNPGANQST